MAREFQVDIYVNLKEGVADPQGATIKHALESLGYPGVEQVHTGKYLQVEMKAENPDQLRRQLEDMCARLLVNPVIEEYRYHIRKKTE